MLQKICHFCIRNNLLVNFRGRFLAPPWFGSKSFDLAGQTAPGKHLFSLQKGEQLLYTGTLTLILDKHWQQWD